MCFIGVYIAGGGQNITGRVVLHVFHGATEYCRMGQNISGRVVLHVFQKGTLYCRRGKYCRQSHLACVS